MIPYSYNMVDMGGIDLAEANGMVVEGLYNRLALARNACGDLILFNWKFAEIEIAPSPCSTLDEGTVIVINGLIQVTEQDEVTVPGINSDLAPLAVTENGQYDPSDYDVDGFSEVTVSIPDPTMVSLTVDENGAYDPADYDADGFNQVTVDVDASLSSNVVLYLSSLPYGSEYPGYVYNTQFAQNCGLVLLADASQGADTVQLTEPLSNFTGVVLQGIYNKNRTSEYNTTSFYIPTIGGRYWAGMKDRNRSYTCYVTFTSDTTATLSGNKQVIIYGIP